MSYAYNMLIKENRPRHDDFQREAAKDASGDAFAAKVLARAKTPVETCFIGATTVWTDKGLVPIEQIRIGDLVLSQNELTGERALKRVVQTFRHEQQEVVRLAYWIGVEGDMGALLVTPNHPAWSPSSGGEGAAQMGEWIAIGDLREGNAVVLASGAASWAFSVCQVYRSAQNPDEYWLYDSYRDESRLGRIPEGADSIPIIPGRSNEWYLHDATDPNFRFTVYNIEVEDFHTYFAGDDGLLVHN